MTTSPRVERNLRAAMERLLSGNPVASDGRLSPESLSKEAGVGRATVYRAKHILDALDERITERRSQVGEVAFLVDEVAALKREIETMRSAHSREIARLLASSEVLAQRVQLLTLENDQLRRRVSQGQGKVTFLQPR